jgi:hypothetical protein
LGGWGCTLSGLFFLASVVVAFRLPLVGIPLVVVAGLIAWSVVTRETAVSNAIESGRRSRTSGR